MNRSNINPYKVILLVIIGIVLIVVGLFFYNFSQIEKKRNAVFDASEKLVMNETDIEEISSKYVYQEKKLYHIFIGKNKEEEELISFIDLKQENKPSKKDIKTYKTDEFISENEILDRWAQTCNQCELVKIQPAIIEGNILWEITYNDVDDRYVFDYYLMTDGKQYEELKLKRNFN